MKQDRIHPRTAVDLQRKFGSKVQDTAESAAEARKAAEQASDAAASATRALSAIDSRLDLTLRVNENGEVISEIHGVANVIKFLANCISIQSDHFTLAEDGKVSISGGSIDIKTKEGGHVRIADSGAQLSIDTDGYLSGNGYRLGILPTCILFTSTDHEIQTPQMPMQFLHEDGEYKYRLSGDWYIGQVKLTDLIRRIEALEGS